jgi:ribose 5-phosphate isomerase B
MLRSVVQTDSLSKSNPAESKAMKIALSSDHAGFGYKERIKEYLLANGHEVQDFGTHTADPCDYPLFVRPVAQAVAVGAFERGIVLGGSGNGEAIVANRVRGVRCALCWDVHSADLARRHNDANVLSVGARMIPLATAMEIVHVFLTTPFDGGRHAARVGMIDPPQPA